MTIDKRIIEIGVVINREFRFWVYTEKDNTSSTARNIANIWESVKTLYHNNLIDVTEFNYLRGECAIALDKLNIVEK